MFEERQGESMNVELFFGTVRRAEAQAVAHGARRHVSRSNPESVVNGFRGLRCSDVTWKWSFGATNTDSRRADELYQGSAGKFVKALLSRAQRWSAGSKADQWCRLTLYERAKGKRGCIFTRL